MTDTSPAPARAFDSGLTTPDFAACLSMGLQPVGLVQGFFCGQVAGWSTYTATVTQRYNCPHNWRGQDHPLPDWMGSVHSLDQAWGTAFYTALQRMLKEAADLGAHGVVGVTTRFGHPGNQHTCEAHLYGTAVRTPAGTAAPSLWSTHLAGHKLAKLVEAGFVPHSIVYARNTSVLSEGCIMESYKHGNGYVGPMVNPLQDLHNQSRQLAMRQAQEATRNESLYDVRLNLHEYEGGTRSTYLTCSLLGSAVRKVRHTLPMGVPVSTVRLSDG